MSVSREEVLRIAALAALEVADDAVPDLAAQMSAILDYVSQIAQVENGEIAPFRPQSNAEAQRLRPDDVRPARPALNPRAFAPDVRDGLFIVPRIGGFGEDDRS